MTFTSDGTCVVKKQYSDDEISAVYAESRQARNHVREFGKVTETVAAYRLKEMRHLQAVEKLATWRRACGFDRLAEDDDSWVHGTRPPTPEEFTASLWSDLKELKNAISMPTTDGSRQRKNSFIQGIEQGTVTFSNEEFARIKQFKERRGRDAAQVTVTPVGAVQYCIPLSPSSEPSFDACVCVEREKSDEGTMDPERDQLEPLLASAGYETPGQQGDPSWETGQTIATGGCGFEFAGRHFFAHRMHWHASRMRLQVNRQRNYDSACSIKHTFPAGEPLIRRQEDS